MDFLRAIDRLVPTQDGVPPVRRHTAKIVNLVNGHADIVMMGATITSVPVLAGSGVQIDDVVEVLAWREGLYVIGRIARTNGDIPGGGGGVDDLFISAAEGQVTAGNPTRGIVGAVTTSATPVFLFPAGETSRVAFLVRPPQSWGSVRIDLLWSGTNAITGSGVTWTTRRSTIDVGAVANVGSLNTVTDATTGSNRLISTTVGTGLALNDGLLRLLVSRTGTASGDTYTADAALWGILVTQTG